LLGQFSEIGANEVPVTGQLTDGQAFEGVLNLWVLPGNHVQVGG